MQLLTAVNLVLPKLGERPVTTLEERHPTLAVLLPIIEQKRREALLHGWWFNSYDYTAQPDVDGKITLGAQTLSFVPVYPDTAALRGTALFNLETQSDVFSAAVKGRVVQDMPFDSLPESAAQYVFYSSLVDVYSTDLGVTQELNVWQALAGNGWGMLVAEHLRQKKYSSRSTRAWAKYKRSLYA